MDGMKCPNKKTCWIFNMSLSFLLFLLLSIFLQNCVCLFYYVWCDWFIWDAEHNTAIAPQQITYTFCVTGFHTGCDAKTTEICMYSLTYFNRSVTTVYWRLILRQHDFHYPSQYMNKICTQFAPYYLSWIIWETYFVPPVSFFKDLTVLYLITTAWELFA